MVVKDGNIHDKVSPWAPYVECDEQTKVFHQVQKYDILTF